MKTISTWTAAFVVMATLAYAAVPQTINYQGYLKDGNGAPVNNKSVSMTFSLYSTTNGAGAVWSGTKSVTPLNGVYSVELGASPQPALPAFERKYWLGVQAGGETEMRPLQPLSSAPYALRAGSVDNADCTGRYEDNGDGTVSDCRTGLIWLKNANCTDSAGGISKSAGYLIWSDAEIWTGGLGQNICGLNDGSGAGDWRLPTKTELMAMVASARKQGITFPSLTNRSGNSKWQPGDQFDNVQSSIYWSSSPYIGNLSNAWVVSLDTGGVYSFIKSEIAYVWPVRSGQ